MHEAKGKKQYEQKKTMWNEDCQKIVDHDYYFFHILYHFYSYVQKRDVQLDSAIVLTCLSVILVGWIYPSWMWLKLHLLQAAANFEKLQKTNNRTQLRKSKQVLSSLQTDK